jgi:hypothetical protein
VAFQAFPQEWSSNGRQAGSAAPMLAEVADKPVAAGVAVAKNAEFRSSEINCGCLNTAPQARPVAISTGR